MGTPQSVQRLLVAARPGAALAVLACVLLTAAPARAARAWQAPVDISVSGEAVAGARVAVDTRGNAVAVWVVGRTSGTGGGLSVGVVRGAVRPAGAVWQTPVDISERDAGGASGADVAVDAQGNAVAVYGLDPLWKGAKRRAPGGRGVAGAGRHLRPRRGHVRQRGAGRC